MNQRIQQFLNVENISQAKFADTIGVTRASVSHILSGRNAPSSEFVKHLAEHYPDLNLNWLYTGTGRMFNSQEGKTSSKSRINDSQTKEYNSQDLVQDFPPTTDFSDLFSSVLDEMPAEDGILQENVRNGIAGNYGNSPAAANAKAYPANPSAINSRATSGAYPSNQAAANAFPINQTAPTTRASAFPSNQAAANQIGQTAGAFPSNQAAANQMSNRAAGGQVAGSRATAGTAFQANQAAGSQAATGAFPANQAAGTAFQANQATGSRVAARKRTITKILVFYSDNSFQELE